MNNYSIILKQYNLTAKEYRQIYDKLIVDTVIKVPFNLNHIDGVIRKLKYLSKSARNNFKFCPRQFQFSRILNSLALNSMLEKKEELKLWDVYGNNTHMVCNKVWNKIDYKTIIKLNTREKIRSYIYSKCISYIPQIEFKINLYPTLLYNYADYESFRIDNIFKEYGNQNCKRYIFPAYRELKVENHEKYEIGIIDVIHRLITDEYAIGDYKMGKTKYYEWEWNPNITEWIAKELEKEKEINWDKITINFELGSYFNLILGMKGVYKIVETNTRNNILEELEFLNITKGFVVYIRDWINTFKYIPLTDEMIYSVDNIRGDIVECINKGVFPLKIKNTCFDFCQFIDVCIKDDKWKINFNRIDSNVKTALDKVFYNKTILENN